MAEEKEGGEEKPIGPQGIDAFFARMSGYVGEKASAFVAFLFLILAAGILIGFFVMTKAPEYIHHAILAPVLLGLIAYYNRSIAVFLFMVAVAFVVFLA